MRIPCPYCSDRDSREFSYLGDATVRRPSPSEPEAFHAYVYLRDNPAGEHSEFWYHASGCRSWLVVKRDTSSHRIAAAALARKNPEGAR